MFRGEKQMQAKANWLDQACHKLKHTVGGATRLWNEMKTFDEQNELPQPEKEKLESAITYFGNNKSKMPYVKNIKRNLPIGSGVTEAACKVIVKQRMCGSAMKWKDKGAASVLRLRCLNYSSGRWDQFWDKVNQVWAAHGSIIITSYRGHTKIESRHRLHALSHRSHGWPPAVLHQRAYRKGPLQLL